MDVGSIIAELKTEQERIGRAIAALLDGASLVRRGRPPKAAGRPKGGISPEGRRRLALAMKRRWAAGKMKKAASVAKVKASQKSGGGMSPAARKRLSEMMKKRWAERRAKP